MASTIDDHNTDSDLPLAGQQHNEFDQWASSVVATAVKIIWAMPTMATAPEIRRRIARAEALRIARRQRRAAPPIPEHVPPATPAGRDAYAPRANAHRISEG